MNKILKDIGEEGVKEMHVFRFGLRKMKRDLGDNIQKCGEDIVKLR